MLMLLLASAVAAQDRHGDAERAIRAVAGSIEDHSQPERWRELLAGSHVVYFSAGDTRSPRPRRRPAVQRDCPAALGAMTSASFRHGPIEVVDADFLGFLFASSPVTRHLDDALASNLRRMWSRIHSISDSGFFAPVSEIVPVQLAAFHAAEMRGWSPQVPLRFAGHIERDRLQGLDLDQSRRVHSCG